jgi:hypothetical protein
MSEILKVLNKKVELKSEVVEFVGGALGDRFEKAFKSFKTDTKDYGSNANLAQKGHDRLDSILEEKKKLEAEEQTVAKDTKKKSDRLMQQSNDGAKWLKIAEDVKGFLTEKYKELGIKPPKELESKVNEMKSNLDSLQKRSRAIIKLPLKKK